MLRPNNLHCHFLVSKLKLTQPETKRLKDRGSTQVVQVSRDCQNCEQMNSPWMAFKPLIQIMSNRGVLSFQHNTSFSVHYRDMPVIIWSLVIIIVRLATLPVFLDVFLPLFSLVLLHHFGQTGHVLVGLC